MTVARWAIEVPSRTRRTSGSSMGAPSAGIIGAPRDVVGDRSRDVEGRREASVAGEPGGVEVGVVAGTGLPSGPQVEPQAGGDRLHGIRELPVDERPAAGDVVG